MVILVQYSWTLQVCWLCEATQGNDGDLSLCLTDVSPQAAWWNTLHSSVPWNVVPSFAMIHGFKVSMIVPDLLHCWNLGCARDLIGSIMKIILSEQVVFPGTNLKLRLAQATESLKTYAKHHRYPLRLRKFTQSKLRWERRKYPSLAASGYDSFVVGKWLEHVLSGHTQRYPEVSTLLWASNQGISLLYAAGRFLDCHEKRSLEMLGSIYLTTYMSLARTALEQRVLLWKIRPKFHLLSHVFRSPRIINPAFYSTWLDEDFLKKAGRTLGLTDTRGSQRRLLQRWLLSMPGHFKMSLKI